MGNGATAPHGAFTFEIGLKNGGGGIWAGTPGTHGLAWYTGLGRALARLATAELLAWLGLSRISRASSGFAAQESLARIVDRKTTRHTSGVKGILLNIPFLPARNVGDRFNKVIDSLSRKKSK